MSNQVKVAPGEICPCGKKETYRNCCWEKNFDWVINDEGEVSKITPINTDVEDALENSRQVFNDLFGREPYDTDPLFPQKYFYSDEDVEQEVVQLMQKSGIEPQFIYAYEKTGGLIVTEENWDDLPTKDQEDWDNAIDEYFELQDNAIEDDPLELAGIVIIEDLQRMIIIFGYILEHGQNQNYKGDYSYSKYISIDEYAIICAAKSFKTLRSIKFLLDKGIGADSLALARSIYESYLHISFVKSEPNKIETFFAQQLGIKGRTHEYAKNKKGYIDRRKIIRIEDRMTIDGHISMYRMASASEDTLDVKIFDGLYEFLSEFSHTGLSYLTQTDSVSLTETELQFEAVFYTSTFSIFILDQLIDLSILTEEAKKDLAITIAKTCKNLLTFFDMAYERGDEMSDLRLLRAKIIKINSRHGCT